MDIEVRDGIVYAPGARLIDRTGRRVLPIGRDGFEPAAESFVLVDKTMLISDVLDSGYAATLFCRPRRFGKTLNMTMLRAFLEDAPDGRSRAALFEGTEVWEAGNGCYRKHQGAYPVVHVSFNTVKKDTWEASYGEIRNLVAVEYERHAYLANSDKLSTQELRFFDSMRSGAASDADVAGSLAALCRLLYKHHGRRVVLLVDEYDAPVMAGYSAPGGGYYREVVTFLKGWLTGAIKDGGAALAFACLTGVQRISKESIFSDLNNLVVSTALDSRFDERYGFTDAEVEALATYLGHAGCKEEARVVRRLPLWWNRRLQPLERAQLPRHGLLRRRLLGQHLGQRRGGGFGAPGRRLDDGGRLLSARTRRDRRDPPRFGDCVP